MASVSDTTSEPLLHLVWYSSAALLGLTLMLLLLTLLMHKDRQRRISKKQQVTELWTPILFNWLYDADADSAPQQLPPLDAAGFAIVVQLWLQLEQTVRGEASGRLAELAERLGFIPVMHQWLDSYEEEKQLTAIMALGLVQDKSAFNQLMPYVLDNRTLFSLVAARALLTIDPWLGLPVILSQLQRDDWSVNRLAGLLVRLPNDLVVRTLRECAERATSKELKRLIKLMAILSPFDCQPLVQLALQKYPDEKELIATACASAITPDLLPLLRQQLHSVHWEVRVQLAKALLRLGDRDDMPLLLELIKDPVWWVRYRAAQSLMQLPGTSQEDQQQWLTLEDKYARDILRQVMDEASEGGEA